MKKLLLSVLVIPLSNSAMDVSKELLQVAQIGLGGAAAAYAYSHGAEFLSRSVDPLATREVDEKYRAFKRGLKKGQHMPFNKLGALGSWWIGLPFIAAMRVGTHRMEAQDLMKPAAIAYGAATAVALIKGGYTYFTSHSDDQSERRAHAIEAATRNAFFGGTFFAPTGLLSYILYKRFTEK